jgi:thiol-disulfide isomerase/thioredoxin
MLLSKFNSIEKGKQLINKTKNSNILVLYHAEWCGYCKMFKPEWKKIHTAITKTEICEVAEVESEELEYVKPLKEHFKGFPSLVLYTKQEITKPKNNGLMNMFMDQNDGPKLPKNAIKYEGERTLNAIQSFLEKHIVNTSKSKGKAKETSKSTTSRSKKNTRKTMKGGMRTQGKTGKKTKKNKKNSSTKANINKGLKAKHSSNTNYSKSTEYYTKQEIAKMKKERKKSAQIVSRLKRELNTTFKV